MARNPAKELDQAQFSRGQKNIVDALAAIYPRRIYIDDLVDNVYQLDPNGGPENAADTVRTQICYIRKRLPQFGWDIPYNSRGAGNRGYYRLVATEAPELAEAA